MKTIATDILIENLQQSEVITSAINQLRQKKVNDIEIALEFLSGSIPVLIEVQGAKETANYFRRLADSIQSSDLDTLN